MDTPNGQKGGIWMTGGGLSTDGSGNIFLGTGNGTFSANKGGSDYGDSALRMTLSNSGLALADYFTPGDQMMLEDDDRDMGTSAVLLLPPQGGPVPRLGVVSDKSGEIYLLNLSNMGKYITPGNSSLQSFAVGNNISSSFAFFNNALYTAPNGLPMEEWTFNTQTERLVTTPHSRSATVYGCHCAGSGSTPSISANGTANGILWALDNFGDRLHPAILHAYDAANLATELYNSTQAANGRDAAANAIKFTTPTIANGNVYVGGRNAVTVYGILSNNAQLTATPTFSPAAGTYSAAQSVTILDTTPHASIYYTANGNTPSTGSTLYTGPIQVAHSETLQAVALAPGFSQSADASASYTIGSSSTCGAPSAPGVNVCKPVNGSTVASPVPVQAAATVTGTILRMEVWVDGVKKFSTLNSRTLSTSLSLANGSHTFAFVAVNTAGAKWTKTVSATVH